MAAVCAGVGIPRGLMNTQWEKVFNRFFAGLEIPVRWSRKSTEKTFYRGKKRILDEFCLPLKLFAGHVLELAEETDLPLFVPLIAGNRNRDCFLCHNQFRAPDILVNSDLVKRERLLSPHFRFDNNLRLLPEGFFELGRQLGSDDEKVRELISAQDSPEQFSFQRENGEAVAVLGRSYVLNDPWLSRGIVPVLKDLGYRVIPVSGEPGGTESEDPADLSHFALTAGMINQLRILAGKQELSGIVVLKPFLCGPDCGLEKDAARALPTRSCIPVLSLVIDENQSDGGLKTRLEAFSDLMSAKRRVDL